MDQTKLPNHSIPVEVESAIKLEKNSETGVWKQHEQEEEKDTLAYKFLTQEQCATIMEQTPIDMTKTIAEILEFHELHLNLREAIIADYYVGGLCWARDEQSFNEQQVSAIATVLKIVYESIAEKGLDFHESVAEFRKLFVGIGTDNCEFSGGLELFDLAQAKLIMDFFFKTVFMNFRLHRIAFTGKQKHDVITSKEKMELPMSQYKTWPPPLHEGLPIAVYQQFIAPPCPTSQASKSTASVVEEALPADDKMNDLLSQLSKTEVEKAFKDVLGKELGHYKAEVLARLRMKENDLIQRINRVHVVQTDENSTNDLEAGLEDLSFIDTAAQNE